jgi:hypothetical protein
MTLTVSPSQESSVSENRMASGISIRMMTVEEQQNHHPDQSRRQCRFADDPEHRGFDEYRLIADGIEVQTRGQAFLDPRQQGFYPFDDVERRSRPGLEDRHQHRPRAVDAHQVGLRR